MQNLFDLLISKKLSPDQYYLIHSVNQGVSPVNINIHKELKILQEDKWIDSNNKLTQKSSDLLNEVIGLFTPQKKKDAVNVNLGSEFSSKVKEYLEIFPNEKLPSGKRAWSDIKNLETNFKWFFENYKYNWDVILKATAMYVDEYERKSPRYLYMRTSQYFIKKMEPDRSIQSELANYCADIESGGATDSKNDSHFSEKVV